MTQLEEVKEHLKVHGSISSWDAIQEYKITRLAQYILLLKKEGWNILSEWKNNENRRWVEYFYKPKSAQLPLF